MAHHHYGYADYVALESSSNVKHEFFAGEIYAKAGGTPEHAALASAISGLLFPQLRNGPCRLYSSDLRIRVMATGLATYPDVSIVCGALEHDPDSATTVVNPRVVIEVLSSGTEDYDRGEKLEHYRQIPSLASIVLVASRSCEIVVWTRATGEQREPVVHGPGASVELPAVSARLVVDEVYDAAGV